MVKKSRKRSNIVDLKAAKEKSIKDAIDDGEAVRAHCGGCQWWNREEAAKEGTIGKTAPCNGAPPSVVILGLDATGKPVIGSFFPRTDADVYCSVAHRDTGATHRDRCYSPGRAIS